MAYLKKIGKNNAKLPDIASLIAAGIDPKTGLPIKMGGTDEALRNETIRLIEVIDRQDYVNRGIWYNLPPGIDSQELERMMYYKGQLAFFYVKEENKFYFMPFALDGGLDMIGRFKRIHPVPFNEESEAEDKKEKIEIAKLRSLLSTMKKHCVYEMISEEDIINSDLDMINDCCVLLRDYTPAYSQYVIPRANLQRPLINQEADFFCYTRTAGLIALGIKAMRVSDADQEGEVTKAAKKYKDQALSGIPWTAITSTVEFQDLATSTGVKPDEFLMILQSIDNLRLRAIGIDNGGIFQKKAQELKDQAAINGGPIGLEAQDYITRRQQFCLVANALFGLSMWYMPSENIINEDRNQDGAVYDDKQDQMNDTSYDNTTEE